LFAYQACNVVDATELAFQFISFHFSSVLTFCTSLYNILAKIEDVRCGYDTTSVPVFYFGWPVAGNYIIMFDMLTRQAIDLDAFALRRHFWSCMLRRH